LDIHTKNFPKEILLQGQKLKRQKNKPTFEASQSGWYYEAGMLHIKTPYIATDINAVLQMK
jgi:hypothetical protein